MFEECFAMIELNPYADFQVDAGTEPDMSFSDLTTILVNALEEALFEKADACPHSIH